MNVDGSYPGDSALHNPFADSPLLDLSATHATVAPAAQEVIRRELATAAAIVGRPVEIMFACGWDPTIRTITYAKPIARGALTMVQFNSERVAPGELAIHNHPSACLCPSENDMERIAAPQYGDGIVSPDATRVYLLREPENAAARARHYFGGRLSVITTATRLLVAWTRRPEPATAHP